jgi:hypothetical protein
MDTRMHPVHHEPHVTFRFADDRIISRVHLEGVEAGTPVAVYRIDPGERPGLLRAAAAGEGGWVDLRDPLAVRAGDGFVAVPERKPPPPRGPQAGG